MGDTLRFAVPGLPRPKERPRVGRNGNIYTPKTTRMYEEAVQAFAMAARAKCGYQLDESERYVLTVEVYLPDGRRMDADNVVKVIADALNGIAYQDDSQIDVWQVEKHRHDPFPRVEVQVSKRKKAV